MQHKTMRFTKLASGYWLASRGLRSPKEGPFQTWDDLKQFVSAEVGDGRNLFVWVVCGGVAHLLSVRVTSLMEKIKTK